MSKAASKSLVALIRGYGRLRRDRGQLRCKYSPSCSKYGEEAIITYGPLKGTALALWRLLRCNPFSKGGYDPVLNKDQG